MTLLRGKIFKKLCWPLRRSLVRLFSVWTVLVQLICMDFFPTEPELPE
jgi:hypothetical protein